MENLSTPQPVKNGNTVPTPIIVYLILLIGLLPVHAAYYAFTRATPLWLQWSIVGMLTVGSLYLVILSFVDRHTMSGLRRWTSLLISISFLVCLYGLFLFTKMPVHKVMEYSCLSFLVLAKSSDFLLKRVENKRR